MFEEKDNFVIMEEGLREVWEGVKVLVEFFVEE